MGSLRVALFVEGSESPPTPRRSAALKRVWNDDLAPGVGVSPFDVVVPISKLNLVAMDPENPAMSGNGEGLDQLMVRMMAREPFDAAVVAWDLVPRWNPLGSYCRWDETLDFYRLLSESECLPEPWKRQAGKRWRAGRQTLARAAWESCAGKAQATAAAGQGDDTGAVHGSDVRGRAGPGRVGGQARSRRARQASAGVAIAKALEGSRRAYAR